MTLADDSAGVTISTWGRSEYDGILYQRWSVRSDQPRFFIELPDDTDSIAVLGYAIAVVRHMRDNESENNG